MRISDRLRVTSVFHDLQVSSKEDAIRFLAGEIAKAEPGMEADRILRAVMERERIMSTGVGKGLAIPHGKVNGLNDSHVAFARLREPIEYGSIDGQPVNLVFMLVGPESQGSAHIRMLSRISRLMNNESFRSELLSCTSCESIVSRFQAEEQLLG